MIATLRPTCRLELTWNWHAFGIGMLVSEAFGRQDEDLIIAALLMCGWLHLSLEVLRP